MSATAACGCAMCTDSIEPAEPARPRVQVPVHPERCGTDAPPSAGRLLAQGGLAMRLPSAAGGAALLLPDPIGAIPLDGSLPTAYACLFVHELTHVYLGDGGHCSTYDCAPFTIPERLRCAFITQLGLPLALDAPGYGAEDVERPASGFPGCDSISTRCVIPLEGTAGGYFAISGLCGEECCDA